MTYQRLGDLLLSIHLITDEQLQQALSLQRGSGKRLGTVLIENGFINERQLIEALELQLGIEFVDLSRRTLGPELSQLFSKNIARKYGVVPIALVKDEVVLAMSDPLNFVAIEEVKAATRRKVVPVIATADAVERAITTLYGNEGAARAIEEMERSAANRTDPAAYTSTAVEEDVQSAPTVRLVNTIIERAVTERASDIHLEPRETEFVVRLRVDGLLRETLTVPKNLQASVISRLKILGSMDIAERRIPQDGRANVRVKGSDIDLRISTLPTIFGEKVVIRLLDKSAQYLDRAAIGLTGDDLVKFDKLMSHHSGVILIVGPTGSGKSSTMSTMIRELSSETVNVVTLEDPVEYHIENVNQVQINEKSGMTFANGLRAILRQDPDVISVGEIRDHETAEIAMRSALTGHLVLSTIHTNDAISTINRLLDIGVEPYLIGDALLGVISQRLVRRTCPACAKPYLPTEDEARQLGVPHTPTLRFYRGAGCPMCLNRGYKGRTAVFEILTVTPEVHRCIADSAPAEALHAAIARSGFVSLTDNCRRLVLEGVTTSDEARRTIFTAEV